MLYRSVEFPLKLVMANVAPGMLHSQRPQQRETESWSRDFKCCGKGFYGALSWKPRCQCLISYALYLRSTE